MQLTKEGNMIILPSFIPMLPFNSKLHVSSNTYTIRCSKPTQSNTTPNYGSQFEVSGAKSNIALYGASIGNSPFVNLGVVAMAQGGTYNYGLFGGAGCPGNAIAGLFDGNVNITNAWTPSDENLKSNIEELTNVMPSLLQLNPKSYEFISDLAGFNAPEGLQYGLLAQNLEEFYPNCVKNIETAPSIDNNEGGEDLIFSSMQVKVINYDMLIPLLVAGYQEQEIIISNQSEEITQLLNRLTALENIQETSSERLSIDPNLADLSFELDQNYPNPFKIETTISYSIKNSGEVKIVIQNSNLEVIAILIDEKQESGSYTLKWNAPSNFKGIAYCVMELNGQKLVRKMLKL